MNRVAWLIPGIERGTVRWPACQADISTEEARKYRERNGKPVACELRAKVNYEGTMLCIRHAQARALVEMIGATSPFPTQPTVTERTDG